VNAAIVPAPGTDAQRTYELLASLARDPAARRAQ
jgi:hypothetical protein